MRSPTQYIPLAAVACMAATALASAWFTLRQGADGARPDRPLEVSVVRAPPHGAAPDTRSLGGPPAGTTDPAPQPR